MVSMDIRIRVNCVVTVKIMLSVIQQLEVVLTGVNQAIPERFVNNVSKLIVWNTKLATVNIKIR